MTYCIDLNFTLKTEAELKKHRRHKIYAKYLWLPSCIIEKSPRCLEIMMYVHFECLMSFVCFFFCFDFYFPPE